MAANLRATRLLRSYGKRSRRFQNGTLTDVAGNVFTVRSNITGATFNLVVDDLPGGLKPVVGLFRLRDDDLLQDGQDVPMPDTSTLAAAMAEAYVDVVFDLPGEGNVAFDLNVESAEFDSTELEDIITANWTSRLNNNEYFWVAYILGAFQGPQSRDGDPNSETIRCGVTSGEVSVGGSMIYIESNRDAAVRAGGNVAVWEQDTVVHEVGHAVGNSGDHPVTGGDSNPVGTYSRYVPAYIAKIRASLKPRGNS